MGCMWPEVSDLTSVIGDLDALYMTRVQKERFFNEDDYLRRVGCMWPPSPALITGTLAASAATRAAPSLGWRMATTST